MYVYCVHYIDITTSILLPNSKLFQIAFIDVEIKLYSYNTM